MPNNTLFFLFPNGSQPLATPSSYSCAIPPWYLLTTGRTENRSTGQELKLQAGCEREWAAFLVDHVHRSYLSTSFDPVG